MQEGIISLMQMEKTSSAVNDYKRTGLLYLSVITDPCMGGVFASFASQADIIIGEKGARAGFAGSRIVKETLGENMQDEIQRVEYQKEHGFIDVVLEREKIASYIKMMISIHQKSAKCKHFACTKRIHKGYNDVGAGYEKKEIKKDVWEKINLIRNRMRPNSIDYVKEIFGEFYELSGDRIMGDDPAIIAGLAWYKGKPVTIIGQEKGRKSIDDSINHNWGMTSPYGFRKILRIIKQAEKFHRPIICFVDTIGALCGEEAEKNGQSSAISSVLEEVSSIKVPILSIIVGEGYSGGALSVALGNEVWMMENAIYSIISPEAYSSILKKSHSLLPEVVNEMGLEVDALLKLGVIDGIIGEPEQLSCYDMSDVCMSIKDVIDRFIFKYSKMKPKKVVADRKRRFRRF